MKIKNLERRINEEILKIQPIEKGIESTQVITTDSNKYILKSHTTSLYNEPEAFKAGAKIIDYLSEKNYKKIPQLKLDPTQFSSETEKYLLTFVSGNSIEKTDINGNNSQQIVKNLAKNLAKINNISPPVENPGWIKYQEELGLYTKNNYFDTPEFVFCEVERKIEEINKKQFPDIINKVNNLLEKLEIKDNQASLSVCHWDYKYDNIIFTKDYQVKAVLDWDLPIAAEPLYNICCAEKHIVGHSILEEKDEKLLKTFREKYCEHSERNIDFSSNRVLLYRLSLLLENLNNFEYWYNKEMQSKVKKEIMEQLRSFEEKV